MEDYVLKSGKYKQEGSINLCLHPWKVYRHKMLKH